MNESTASSELEIWISELIDGTISEADVERLRERLNQDDDAVETYLDAMALETLLAEERVTGGLPVGGDIREPVARRRRRLFSGLVLGGLVALAGLLAIVLWPSPHAEVLAQRGEDDWLAGDRLRFEAVAIKEGSLDLRMASGVELVVHAPARFEVTGPNQLSLEEGKLSADVPPEATGFQVLTPNGNIIDHGTRIGVSVNPEHTDLHVVEGRAEIVLPSDDATRGASAMVGRGQAFRLHSPDNSGYEPIALRADVFFEPEEVDVGPVLYFGFETNHPPWTATALGTKDVDRGDVPASPLTKGVEQFVVVNGWVALPTHQVRVGTFHRPDRFAPFSGEARLLPLPFHFRDEMPTLRTTSPAFRFHAGGGSISAFLIGGRGRADSPGERLEDVAAESDGDGFMGLALRRVSDDRYLCSVRRDPGNFYDWAQVTLSAEAIGQAIQNDRPDEMYVLDLIDTYRDPDWGWIGLDDVSISGYLVFP